MWQNGQERREKSILSNCKIWDIDPEMHVMYVQHFFSYKICDFLVTCSLNTLLYPSHAFPPHLCFMVHFISGSQIAHSLPQDTSRPLFLFFMRGKIMKVIQLYQENENLEY